MGRPTFEVSLVDMNCFRLKRINYCDKTELRYVGT